MGVTSVAFSPDDWMIISGNRDKFVKLWKIDGGKEVRTFTGHSGPVFSVAFSPDGLYALSGSGDGEALQIKNFKLWNVITGKELVA